MSLLKTSLRGAMSAFLACRLLRVPVSLTGRSFHESFSQEPCHPIPGKEPKWMSAEESVSVIKSGIRQVYNIIGLALRPRPPLTE